MRSIKRLLTHVTIWLLGLPVGVVAQNLRIENGCRVIVIGSARLVLHNAGIINNGNFTFGWNPTIRFTGDQSVVLGGSNAYTFINMLMAKSNGATVQMQQNVSVAGAITMKAGNLLLNNHTLDLGTTGSIEGESDQSYITGINGGRVLVTRDAQSPVSAFNPGNIGIELTTAVVPGTITVERKHVAEALANGYTSIYRTFTISAATRYPLNATVRLYYFDKELGGNDEVNLMLWKNSDVFNGWSQLGKDADDISANWVQKNQIDKLGRFTLAAPAVSTKQLRAGKVQHEGKDAATTAQVYPNPATSQFTLTLNAGEEKEAQFSLYDQSGRLIQQKKLRYKAGVTNIIWNVSNYTSGVYLLTDDSGTIKVKVIKR